MAFSLVCWSGRVARGIPFGIALGDEKTRNDNAYLVQAWVLGFYNALRSLEAFRDGGVVEDQVCCS